MLLILLVGDLNAIYFILHNKSHNGGFFFLLFNEMLSSVAAVCSLVAAFSVRELGQSSSADAKKRLVWDSGVINF